MEILFADIEILFVGIEIFFGIEILFVGIEIPWSRAGRRKWLAETQDFLQMCNEISNHGNRFLNMEILFQTWQIDFLNIDNWFLNRGRFKPGKLFWIRDFWAREMDFWTGNWCFLWNMFIGIMFFQSNIICIKHKLCMKT